MTSQVPLHACGEGEGMKITPSTYPKNPIIASSYINIVITFLVEMRKKRKERKEEYIVDTFLNASI